MDVPIALAVAAAEYHVAEAELLSVAPGWPAFDQERLYDLDALDAALSRREAAERMLRKLLRDHHAHHGSYGHTPNCRLV